MKTKIQNYANYRQGYTVSCKKSYSNFYDNDYREYNKLKSINYRAMRIFYSHSNDYIQGYRKGYLDTFRLLKKMQKIRFS